MPSVKHRRNSTAQIPAVGKAVPPAAPQPAPQGQHTALIIAICAALVIATFAAFGGLLSSGFTNYDDRTYITENTHVQKGLSRESIAWAFTTTCAANWHPLTWLSHMLDIQLFGLDAGRHHLTSLLMHTLNAVLLFLLLLRMSGALWRCAFVAALFALHPLHVESVAFIAERKDVLSTLFWLLTLGAWLNYVKSRKAAPYALALALYALGLMAKPMLVTLPFTLLLLDFWPLRRLALPLRRRSGALKGLLWEKAPLFAMSAASCVITFVAQRTIGTVATLEKLGFDERLANAALACVSYLGKTVWPSSLAVFYPHPRTGLVSWPVVGAVLLLAGATVLVLRLAKRAPYLPFGWFWYVGTLVPVIGIIQVGGQGMADRYTYVPLIGIFIGIAFGLAELAGHYPWARLAVPLAAAASLVALFPVTRVQTGTWAGSEALFGHALAVTSDNWMAHNNLGVVLFEKGRKQEAIAHYEEAIRINPDFAEAQNNLGVALDQENRTSEAMEHFHQALRIKPDSVQALDNLGLALAKLDRLPEALERFEQAVRIAPDDARAHFNLGFGLAREHRLTEAQEQFQQALRIKPDYEKARTSLQKSRKALGLAP